MNQNPADLEKQTFFQGIGRSIFPHKLRPQRGSGDYRRFFNTLILHFRPRTVPERTLRLTLTWGLGGMAVVLVFILMGTGVLLKFVYEPFPTRAFESVLYFQQDVLFGQLIRNIHHWSGNLLLIVVFLHLVRIFFTGAFHPPRQFNWIIGLGLFFIAIFSNFTGYLLPWDQLSFWAVTISTGMLEYAPVIGRWLQLLIQGGPEVGPATLSNFYAIHTAILPALFIILMPFHFWRVRKAGGLVVPRSPEEKTDVRGESVNAIPYLILRETVVALVLIAFVLIVSMLFNAPLETKANPGLSPNPTKAPWYFSGIQEMLMHFHPLFSLFILPMLMIIGLLAFPYMDYDSNTSGVWFISLKGRKMAVIAAFFGIIAASAGILVDEYIVDLSARIHGLPPLISNGMIPFAAILAGSTGFYIWIKRKYSATNNEAIQAIFVLFLAVFIVFTITGIWFRGTGMRLMWP